ncbi:MAG: DUF2341 domain-containing protein, partial [Candidatus Thorarchaeota archaeon]
MKVRKCSILLSIIAIALLTIPICNIPNTMSQTISAEIVEPIDHSGKDYTPATGVGWLPGWTYRKAHTLDGVTGAGTGYQVKVTVHYGSGTDSGEDVYCDSKCQTDFDDIRFTDDLGVLELSYWREEYTDSSNAIFWVKIEENLDDGASFHMYYGNPLASSESNGTDTFEFFDDFEDASIDTSLWDVHGSWTEVGGLVSFSLAGTGATVGLPCMKTDSKYEMRNRSLVSRWRVNELTTNREWGVSCADTAGDDHTRLSYFLTLNTSGENPIRAYFDATATAGYDHYDSIIGSFVPNEFMITEFISTPDHITKNAWIQNGTTVSTYSSTSLDSIQHHVFLGFYVYGWSNFLNPGNLDFDYDYVYIRKTVGTEPTHGVWGSQESEWLDGMQFRKSHEILGTSGAGTNYQVQITVMYGIGTDSGSEAYCGTNCQSDFDDIRFTDDDGVTELDYWREEYVPSDTATFWVEVADN